MIFKIKLNDHGIQSKWIIIYSDARTTTTNMIHIILVSSGCGVNETNIWQFIKTFIRDGTTATTASIQQDENVILLHLSHAHT